MNAQETTNDASKIVEMEGILSKALHEGKQNISHYMNLGLEYYWRYDHTRGQQDLDNAITTYKDGLANCPFTTEQHGWLLHALGSALSVKYNHFGAIEDWEKAIGHYEQVLDLYPAGHPHRSMTLNNLGNALRTRYRQLGDVEYLEKAINHHKQALDSCPAGHPDRSIYLDKLGSALETRYQQLGEVGDLEEAISLHEQALDLCPASHLHRPISLSNLGKALESGYEQLGDMEYLEKAIGHYKEALDLCPAGHPDKSMSLNNLGNALEIRYKQLGEIEDLEQASSLHEQALDLRPPGHPHRPISLNNLGNALYRKYEQLGEMGDLENSISHYEQALNLCPVGHPDRSMSLNNLGTALETRYKQLGEIEDLEQAIGLHEQALDLCPSDHPDKSMSLNNLGNALEARYRQLGGIEDLKQAISLHEQALDLRPVGHTQRFSSLNNLAKALTTKYEQLEEMEDLETAISHYKQALYLCPAGHADRSMYLDNLGSTFENRYQQLGEIRDLEEAFSHHEQALDLRPPGHPDRPTSLNNLGLIHYLAYQNSGNNESLSQAIDYYRQAAYATSSLPHILHGAKNWALLTHTHKLSSGGPAYSLAMNLLHQSIALLPSLASQQKLVEKSSSLSLDAAAWAIEIGTLDIAVQYLEQGRSILWSKIQGYKQPLKDIAEKAPHLAKEFSEVSHILALEAISGHTDISLHNTQYKRWITLLEEIRLLDGFSDYLQAPPFRTLGAACIEGPVIMVNISDFRSDAIILVVDSPPILVPLQDAMPQRLEELVNQLLQVTATSSSSATIYKILQYLWNTIVQPVVMQLQELGVPEKSHIWWCPTSYLCALPLHAAGLYQKGAKNLPDLYISSYTPTLASLIKARSNISKHKFALSLLLISQPDDTIPQVFEESKVINKVTIQVNSLAGCNANKQGVLESLQSHPWVHFACHGHLEAQPFHSWFQLYNKEHLTVLDLAGAQLPNAEFAFLSACHSAAGSVHGTPDESIHLAGALQVSGFRSVIGTLWAMVDDDGPPLADAFYNEIIDELGNVNVRDAAEALNIATRNLRRKQVPVERWINFVHIGA